MPADSNLHGQTTAAGILGHGRSRRKGANSSLEREVSSYLDDMEEGSGVLAYWQVGKFSLLIITILTFVL